VAGLVALVLVAGACGDDTGDGSTGDDESVLSGIVREPAPQVDGTTLPSLTEPGTDIDFVAPEGGIQVVYFGFTNCPDVCPTTLADLTVALRKMDPADAARIETVMVTVDPERDTAILDDYVTSFIPDALAAGTDDEATLRAAGEPFGASWEVRTLDDGTVEVDHSPFLYAVDDTGRLVLTWQFGASSDDMKNDLELLLARDAPEA
jgi:protein SCO1/2